MKKLLLSLPLFFLLAVNANAQPPLGQAGSIVNCTDCDVDLHVGCVELPECATYELGASAGVTAYASPGAQVETPIPASGCPSGSYVFYYVTWSDPACSGIQSTVFVSYQDVLPFIRCNGEDDTSVLPGCTDNGCDAGPYNITWAYGAAGPPVIEVGCH